MKPRLILLVRHGESEANRNWSVNVSMPNHKVPLTEFGLLQAEDCGIKIRRLLKPDEKVLVFQSPYTRARQTADGILSSINHPSETQHWEIIERREDPRMREQDFGNFQEHDEMKSILREREHYGFFFYRIPDGESPADVYDRCSSFCETLFRSFDRHSADVVLLVSHGIWGRIFLMRYFHWTYEYFESLSNLPNAVPIVLELQENGKYKLKTELERWAEPETEQKASEEEVHDEQQ